MILYLFVWHYIEFFIIYKKLKNVYGGAFGTWTQLLGFYRSGYHHNPPRFYFLLCKDSTFIHFSQHISKKKPNLIFKSDWVLYKYIMIFTHYHINITALTKVIYTPLHISTLCYILFPFYFFVVFNFFYKDSYYILTYLICLENFYLIFVADWRLELRQWVMSPLCYQLH